MQDNPDWESITLSPGLQKAMEICMIPSFEPINGKISFSGFRLPDKSLEYQLLMAFLNSSIPR